MSAALRPAPPARTSHRQVAEHVDVKIRDRALNRAHHASSHRHCAGGPNCLRPRVRGVMSLPGSTLAAALAAATALLGRTTP